MLRQIDALLAPTHLDTATIRIPTSNSRVYITESTKVTNAILLSSRLTDWWQQRGLQRIRLKVAPVIVEMHHISLSALLDLPLYYRVRLRG